MWKDPIVEEVRKVRDEHAAKYDYDLKRIVDALKKEEEQSTRQFTILSPRKLKEKEEA